MKKRLVLLLALGLLCACQEVKQPDPQAVSAYVQELEIGESGVLLAQDLDLNGIPELYLIYESGDYQNKLLAIGLDDEPQIYGEITMGVPADDVWWIAHTYNEDKAYLTIDTKGYACAGDGDTSYTQHNITLEKGQLNSFDVLVSEIYGVGTNYMIEGKVITDPKEYRKAMDDYFLQDAQTDVLDFLAYESSDELKAAIETALNPWIEK